MNGFITDKQTLEDLNLVARFKKDSVINIYDRTRTRRGRQIMESMFRSPLSSAAQINDRAASFAWFSGRGCPEFNIEEDKLESLEYYLGNSPITNPTALLMRLCTSRIKAIFLSDPSYGKLIECLKDVCAIVLELFSLIDRLCLPGDNGECPFEKEKGRFCSVFDADLRANMEKVVNAEKISFGTVVKLDIVFRSKLREALVEMQELIAYLDVRIAVAHVADELGLCYAQASDGGNPEVHMRNVRHPALARAVGNHINMDSESNLFFLTGVNMAGKSTFMKSVAIALYLAQMGFPVPAESVSFVPVEGLFTSINVPDNIVKGYSHFYAEVLRVKGIAQRVGEGKKLFVIFDELFKGTNVKDAFDATLSVVTAFAKHRNCLFVVSTHIVEVGASLSETCNSVQFKCLPSEMDGDRLIYRYKLQDGISTDRHGMTIIRNEHILDIIKQGIQ